VGVAYWAARGAGCFRDGERVRIPATAAWREATVSFGEVRRFLAGPRAGAGLALIATARCVRAYGDLASWAMLLDGTADVVLEEGVQVWDLAPAKVLVEEAGGVFTDLEGRPTPASGGAVGGNAALHAHALAALASRAR
jgi:histidinol-phosphatase